MTPINWFELFVSDFERAHAFYQRALDMQMEVVEGMGGRMAMFPYDESNGIGGCLSATPGMQPGSGGTRIYLNAEGRLDAVLDRVPTAGGQIIQSKTAIPPHGFIAVIQDSEGNEVGLHSMS
jgi:hypothetical protein